jgi:hypothetical protein
LDDCSNLQEIKINKDIESILLKVNSNLHIEDILVIVE